MSTDLTKRGFLLASICMLAMGDAARAQHTDSGTDEGGGHSGGPSGGRGGGGQRGRPENPHGGEDDSAEDHTDDHGDEHGDEHEDDHGDDHASGKKGKGPRYKGGRETVSVGVSHGRSLEDRVLKVPSF